MAEYGVVKQQLVCKAHGTADVSVKYADMLLAVQLLYENKPEPESDAYAALWQVAMDAKSLRIGIQMVERKIAALLK